MEERYRFLELAASTQSKDAPGGEIIALMEISECGRKLWSVFQDGKCDVGRAIAALDKLTEAAVICQQAFRFPTIKPTH